MVQRKPDDTANAIENNRAEPHSVFNQRKEWDIDGSIKNNLSSSHHMNLERAFYQGPSCKDQRNNHIQIQNIKHGNGKPAMYPLVI
jgi:hypothetical protein